MFFTNCASVSSTDVSRRTSDTSSMSAPNSSARFPWREGRWIANLPNAAADVCELCFSETNALYAVSQPEQSTKMEKHLFTVLAWSFDDTSGRWSEVRFGILDEASTEPLTLSQQLTCLLSRVAMAFYEHSLPALRHIIKTLLAQSSHKKSSSVLTI
jgi:hypothetical protein